MGQQKNKSADGLESLPLPDGPKGDTALGQACMLLLAAVSILREGVGL